jgi:uncharacterized protein YicC (UPF0701 family)
MTTKQLLQLNKLPKESQLELLNAVIKEEVGGEIKRGKLKIYERLENVEVATGGEADGQTSVVEVQDDGSS